MAVSARECVICDLIAGRLPVSVVHRQHEIIVLMDIQPVTAGHLMIIPTKHAPRLEDLDLHTGSLVFEWAQKVTRAIYHSDLRPEGLNLFLADGEVAGQEVDHVHLHLIPRYTGDGFGLVMPPGYEHRPERAELDLHASAIRSGLVSTL